VFFSASDFEPNAKDVGGGEFRAEISRHVVSMREDEIWRA
jgi:hypothetical protein